MGRRPRIWSSLAAATALCACATTNEGSAPAADNAAAPGPSLYDKYGGAPTVRKVVHDVAMTVFRDCHLAPYLSVVGKPGHASPDRLESCLVLQFSALMGGKDANGKLFRYPGRAVSLSDPANSYDCQDMTTVHAEVGIPGPAYDQFLTDLVSALQADGMSSADIQLLAPHIIGLKPQVVSATPSNLDTARCATDPSTGKVKSPDESLYAKYGGAPTVRKLVGDIVKALVSDCRLSPFLDVLNTPGHDSVDRVESCLDLQISAMLGGRRTDAGGQPLLDDQGNPVPFRYPGAAASFEGKVDGDGDPVTYRCVDMTSSHAYLGISPAAFDAFMGDLVAVLAADGVSQADIQTLGAAVTPLKPQIVSTTPTVLPACTSAATK
jgi:hypothetical protein